MNFETALKKISNRLRFEYGNLLRIKVPDKIVVIESDDWGLERCISEQGFSNLCKKYAEERRTRWFYDSIEITYDLDRLFGLLDQYSNSFVKKPIITGNFITHNIDYSKPESLHFKGITANKELPKESYDDAIRNKLLAPQLHGYSHYNNSGLMEYFYDPNGKEDFNNNFFLAITTTSGNTQKFHGEYANANLNFTTEFEIAQLEFERYFNMRSESIIPCTFILDKEIQEVILARGVKTIQGTNRLTDSNGKKRGLIAPRLSKGIFFNTRYSRLDVHPDYEKIANVDVLIHSMESTFKQNQPCIIDFHRVNFVSKYSQNWADNCLSQLNYFFNYCRLRHPDIIFMSTQELSKYLRNNLKLEY